MSMAIVHGGGITAAASLYGGQPRDWLDLSTGINPNPLALPAIDQNVWHRLPDEHLATAAREAAARHYRCGAILPLPVPGTQSVIQLLPRLADPVRRIAILSPTYGEYNRAFQAAGFAVDAVTELAAIGPQHGLVVIVNPNNPTGRAFAAVELQTFWARLQAQKTLLVVDEAFSDTAPDLSLAPQVEAMPGLIVLRSFGKFFGLAGLRLGFVIAEAQVQAQIDAWLGPWAVSGPALAVAASAMAGGTMDLHRRINERKAALTAVLQAAGLTIAGGTALFALVADIQATALHDHLCRHHILVRKFDYDPSWLRFGLAPDAASDARLAAALSDWKR